MLSVRCRAYSGLESGKLENKSEEHELGDDDDFIGDKSKFVRNLILESSFRYTMACWSRLLCVHVFSVCFS